MSRNLNWLKAGLAVFLVLTAGVASIASAATPFNHYSASKTNRAGDSSFVDIESEYASGNSSAQLGLWYAWINTNNSHVLFLSMSFEGLTSTSQSPLSPVSMVVAQHFNTSSGEVLVANSPTFMEIYNDTNGNGVPDADFAAGISEILYYVIMNSSENFESTPVQKQIDMKGFPHYRWSVRYAGINGLLQYPFPEKFEQYPLITVFIEHIQCSYDYCVRENSSYLKIGFEVSPFSNPRKLNDQDQLVPTDLTLEGKSLSTLFSTLIVTAKPSPQVVVQGSAYNSSTTPTLVMPTDNASVCVENGTVYDFLFDDNYTIIKDGVPCTYNSTASACSKDSVASPYIQCSGGPSLFSRYGNVATVLSGLIPRINSSLQVDSVLEQTSSFFYRISYPTWSNGTLIHDPTYIANFYPRPSSPPSNPGSNGSETLQTIVISTTVGIGIGTLVVALVIHRRASGKCTTSRNTNTTSNPVREERITTQKAKSHVLDVVLTISLILTSSILVIILAQHTPQIPYGSTGIYFSTADIQQTSDGGYIILARREMVATASLMSTPEYTGNRVGSVPEGSQFLLVKADSHGNIQWNRTYGGEDVYSIQSIQQTSDNGFVILMSILVRHSVSYEPASYSVETCIIKMDESGNIQWEDTYGGIDLTPNSLEQTPDGGYIVASSAFSCAENRTDFWLFKTDADGNTRWNKTYGGAELDYVTSFQGTSDGGYLISGVSYPDYITLEGCFLLIKTDQNGTIQWSATYPVSEHKRLNFAQEASEGEYVMAGRIGTNVSGGTITPIEIGWDFWLVKCDANRNALWNKTYDGGGDEQLCSLRRTADGGFMLAGNTWLHRDSKSGIWLLKVDKDGIAEWNSTHTDFGPAQNDLIRETSDDGYIAACYSSKGAQLVKIDSVGSIEWNKTVQFPSAV